MVEPEYNVQSKYRQESMVISYEEEETLDSLGCEISEFLKGSVLIFLSHIYLLKNIGNNSDHYLNCSELGSWSNSYILFLEIRFNNLLQNKT